MLTERQRQRESKHCVLSFSFRLYLSHMIYSFSFRQKHFYLMSFTLQFQTVVSAESLHAEGIGSHTELRVSLQRAALHPQTAVRLFKGAVPHLALRLARATCSGTVPLEMGLVGQQKCACDIDFFLLMDFLSYGCTKFRIVFDVLFTCSFFLHVFKLSLY